MPFQDFNLKATFDEAYDFGAEGDTGHPNTRPEVRVHYHRYIKWPQARRRATKLIAALGWTTPGPKMVIVGAGFSWLAEALEVDHGFTHVVGIDISSYIQAEKDNTEDAEIETEITSVGLNPASGEGLGLKNKLSDGGARTRASKGCLNNDLSTGQMRQEVKQALDLQGNTPPDVIFTESVIENLTDAEFQFESNRLQDWAGQLIHFVVTTQEGNTPGMFNWHTLAEWKALAPSDTFVDAQGYAVL
jgi:hypothetical protein